MKNQSKSWLTIKEASETFHKHSDTIRGLARKNPSITKKDKKGRILIDGEFLASHYGKSEPKEIPKEPEATTPEQPKNNDRLLDALLKELNQKDEEINKLHSIIEKMSEQQNKLIDQQQRLSGFMLQAENPTTEQVKPKKKHWFSRKQK